MKIDETEVFGFRAAMRGMRNPYNSWGNSDSGINYLNNKYFIGENDLQLAQGLIEKGAEHSKFLRFITVYVDIEAPLYFWKEFDTYKFKESNSCSTMHRITSRPLTKEDFEWDIFGLKRIKALENINILIEDYKKAIGAARKEQLFRMIIQDLPSAYLQKRTIVTNYAELRNIRKQRENHKLIEWHKVVAWVDSLEYSELLK